MTEIFVNGIVRHLEEELSLQELLKKLDTPDRGIAVALNSKIVHSQQRATTIVRPGDEIEIVTANPGG